MAPFLPYLLAALVVGAVLLLLAGLYLSWHASKGPQAERLARRLREHMGGVGEQTVSITKQRLLSDRPGVQRLLEEIPGMQALDNLLLQSGRSYTVGQLAGICLMALLLVFAAASLFRLPWAVCLVLALGAAALPILEAARAKTKRIVRIEEQLPDALDLMSRAMRAGHAFPTALKMVADEMSAPLAGEFKAVFDEVNFGVAMADALMGLAARVPSTDLRYFVVAVLIQRETGGNLTELLNSISAIVRDRLKLLGQVRVLSAEGKMSAWVLSLLPFGAGTMMYLSNPEFVNVLFTDPGGRKMVGGAAVMMVLGILVIRKITHIRV